VVSVVVDVDVVLVGRRAGQSLSVLLPVVDGLRERRDDALEDRLAAARLAHPAVRHRYLRSDCACTPHAERTASHR